MLTRDHLAAAGVELGVPNPEQTVQSVLETVRDVAVAETPHMAAQPGFQKMIEQMAESLLAGKTVAGENPDEATSSMATARRAGGWRWDNPLEQAGATDAE